MASSNPPWLCESVLLFLPFPLFFSRFPFFLLFLPPQSTADTSLLLAQLVLIRAMPEPGGKKTLEVFVAGESIWDFSELGKWQWWAVNNEM